MPDDPKPRPVDIVGTLTVVALVLLVLAGWWLFPRLQRSLAFEDCVATGRPNCATSPEHPLQR